jgi:hypothetical protein
MISKVCAALLALSFIAPGSASAQVNPPPTKPRRFERKLFTASGSTEAQLVFRAGVEYRGSAKPTEAEARRAAEKQAQYLFGALAVGKSFGSLMAAPKQVADIKLVNLEAAGAGAWRITYDYAGIIQLAKNGQQKGTLRIPLPNNPGTVWETARKLAIEEGASPDSPCGDGSTDHDGASFLWYVWDPSYEACYLEEGKHYTFVQGKFSRFQNSEDKFKATYPEYERMVRIDPATGKKYIRIDLLMGTIDDAVVKPEDVKEGHARVSPLKQGGLFFGDTGAYSFRGVYLPLVKGNLVPGAKFTAKPWTDAQVEKIAGKLERIIPYVMDLTYEAPTGITVLIRMYMGNTTVGSEGSQTFYKFLRDAFARSSNIIYSGHSSLGEGLNLALIEQWINMKLVLDCEHYQGLYMNGCSSYGYYNRDYFRRKAECGNPNDKEGTFNLDVVTNGLATGADTDIHTDLTYIGATLRWAMGKGSMSYQAMAKQLDSDNLLGVNGDEDPGNIKQP